MSELGALLVSSTAATLVVVVVLVVLHFADALRPRHWLYGAIAWVGVVVLSAVFVGLARLHTPEAPQFAQLGVVVGIFLGTAGWIIGHELTIRANRKKHTFDLITEFLLKSSVRANDLTAIHKRRKEIVARFQSENIPPPARFSTALGHFDGPSDETVLSLDRQLNFFDFVSASIQAGDIDGPLAKRMLSRILAKLYADEEEYIQHWQRQDREIWCELSWLYARWRTPTDPTPKPL